jgi:hypothetical protein
VQGRSSLLIRGGGIKRMGPSHMSADDESVGITDCIFIHHRAFAHNYNAVGKLQQFV